MGRTVRELEATMGADEWDDWVDFHNDYDLPDSYITTSVLAHLGRLIADFTGNPGFKKGMICPYYTVEQPASKPTDRFVTGPFKPGSLAGAFSFLRRYVKPRRKPE